jgi:ribosomal protein S18 acetylase RimI-like enzyme
MDLPIQRLEELALNAWPAHKQVFFDGWVLRFSGGFSKRANSVTPLYSSTIRLQDKITYCENLYARSGLPALFRLSPASTPSGLDQLLAELNYRSFDPTMVMCRSLDRMGQDHTPEPFLDFRELDIDEWLSNYRSMNQLTKGDHTHHELILRAIPDLNCLGAILHQGKAVACGLGVLGGDILGLFDVVTAPDRRRRGYGTRLIRALFAWGRKHGARAVYLQVMASNAPALSLYRRLGFETRYGYWYRMK